jgi:hypothetical protein
LVGPSVGWLDCPHITSKTDYVAIPSRLGLGNLLVFKCYCDNGLRKRHRLEGRSYFNVSVIKISLVQLDMYPVYQSLFLNAVYFIWTGFFTRKGGIINA